MRRPDRIKRWLKRALKSPYFWAVAIRLAYFLLLPVHVQGDAADYDLIATNLASGRGFSRCPGPIYPPTGQRPPLYPMILGILYLIGMARPYAAILLNLALDLCSMKFAETWAHDLRMKWAGKVPWIIAFCPFLITYGTYPTTENISITLFFAALVLLFRQMWLSSGICWGLLSLCRSYFLFFPLMMWVFPASARWKKRGLSIMVAASLLAPGTWMVRNYLSFQRVAFTQTSMVGWQSYPGLCLANFDWWRSDQASYILGLYPFSKLFRTHCSTEDEIADLDRQARAATVRCVLDHPIQVARNILVKSVMLFINWGQLTPYDPVPFVARQLIGGVLCFYWWCVFRVLRKRRKAGVGAREALRFSLVTVAYVFLVTLPFAVDARYLLAPFLTLLICVLELVKAPEKLVLAGTETTPPR